MTRLIFNNNLREGMGPMGCLVTLASGFSFSGEIVDDAQGFLIHHGQRKTVEHSRRVAEEAGHLALQYGEDPVKAEQAGWLHDISAVIPNKERIAAAEKCGLAILPEERIAPMIIHQKLSAQIAADFFKVSDPAVLSAIGCHTTLKANATTLDKIIFLADKIRWDQPGEPPYLTEMLRAVAVSLDLASCVYLNYLWQRRATLPVLHPWVVEARKQLRCPGNDE
jgi:predicted HD superfamily hydrolase involved in NAD metabolism